MVVLGFVVALEMIFYFASIRTSNVTVGVSLEYMAPVWVALLAPWVLHTRRRRMELIAVAVAVGGMALLVLPAATAGDGAVTVPGVVFGLLAGIMFATAMMLVSSMSDAGVRGSTFALFYCAGSVILFTPLAVWQTPPPGTRSPGRTSGSSSSAASCTRRSASASSPTACATCAWSTPASSATSSR